MGLLAALVTYAALIAGGSLAGTGGVIAAVATVLVIEHRLARRRALASIRRPPENHRAHR